VLASRVRASSHGAYTSTFSTRTPALDLMFLMYSAIAMNPVCGVATTATSSMYARAVPPSVATALSRETSSSCVATQYTAGESGAPCMTPSSESPRVSSSPKRRSRRGPTKSIGRALWRACQNAERGLRFKPGDLGHAFEHNGPLDRLERVLRVEYEEDVVT